LSPSDHKGSVQLLMELHLTTKGCHFTHLPYGITQYYPALTPARQTDTRFTYPRGAEGRVDLGDLSHTEMVHPPTDGHPSKY